MYIEDSMVLRSSYFHPPAMLLTEIPSKKESELIAFAKEKLGAKAPSDVDSMEKPVLVELVKDIVKKEMLEKEQAERATPNSPTSPVAANPTHSEAENVENDDNALEALKIMGFDSKDQVKAYLKGVEREKANQVTRLETIAEAQKNLDVREGLLGKRERDIETKSALLLLRLKEVRTIDERNKEFAKAHASV